MDATELRDLRRLSERDVWPVNELPPGIDIVMLGALDMEESIEARVIIASRNESAPAGTNRFLYTPQDWVSPLRKPMMIGTWEQVLRPRTIDEWHPASEIRVSDRGKVILARAARSEPLVMPTGPEFETARALARSFRQMPGDAYPGAIIATCPGEQAMVPVEDSDYEPSRHFVFGMAMWGLACSAPVVGSAPTNRTLESIVPIIACDMLRPPCGVPRIDAWIIRADAIASAITRRMPAVNGLNECQSWAALGEAYAVLRRRTATLLQETPSTAREAILALADVVRQEFPDPVSLDTAARELLAAVSTWKAATGSGSQVPKDDEVDHGVLTQPSAPLTSKQAAVYEIIAAVPSDRGIKGPQIITALGKLKPPVNMDSSTLTRHVIPVLKSRGVRNKKGVGYYVEQAAGNSTSAP